MSEDTLAAQRDANRLITDLGKSVGIDEMAFDEDGRCDLSFDDQMMAIIFDAVTGYLCLEAPVLELPSSPASNFYSWVLEDNFMSFSNGIGCLALHSQAGYIVWLDRKPALNLERAEFENWLAKSIERAEFCARMLRERVNTSSSPTDTVKDDTMVGSEVLFRP